MAISDASVESGGRAGEPVPGGREVSVLTAVAEAVGTSPDLATSLARALETAMQLIGLEAGIIRLWDEEKQALVAWAARGLPPGVLERIACIPPEQGRAGEVFRTGQPIFMEDGAGPPRPSHRPRDGKTYACVPIRSADRILGTLSIGSRNRRRFAPGDPELLSAMGTILGLAVVNGLLVRRLHRRADEVEGLVLASQALASSLEPDAVPAAVVRCASEVADVPCCTLMTLDEADGHLEFRAEVGMPEVGDPRADLWLRQGLPRLVAAGGRPIAIPDLATDPRAGDPASVRRSGLVSFLGVPIRTKERLIGVLSLFTRRPRDFGREELGLVSSFADVAAAALDRARLVKEARRRQAEAEGLAEIGRALSSSLHPDQVLQSIVEHARRLLLCDVANVGIYDPAEGVLLSRAIIGHRDPDSEVLVVRPGQGISGLVLQTGEPFVTDDYLNDPRFSHAFDEWARAEGTVTELVVPVKRDDKVLGVLWVVNRSPRPFTARDRDVLVRFASHAAIALENARLYETIRRELTERRHAEEALRQTEHRYRNLFEDAPVMYVVTGEREGDPIILDCNALFLRTLGYTRAEVLGRPLAAFYTPASRHHLLEGGGYQQALKGEFAAAERQLVTRGGQIIETLLQALPAVDAEGRVTGTHAMYVDITERKRAAEALAERTRQLEAVRAVTEEITRELDLTTLLGLITQRAAQLVGAVSGTVFLWDEGAQVLVPQAWHGMGEWRREARLRLGEAAVGTVAQWREGLIVNDYRTSPYAHPLTLERTAITAVLAEPLLYHDRLVGVIAVNHEGTGHAFTPQDRETLALFASQAAAAVENARLYREGAERAVRLERSLRELQALQGQLVRTEKLHALGEMASGVAHDFNNLLGIVLARAQFLSSLVDDPQVRSGLAVIEKAALDGAATVRRLQEFTRPGGGEEAFEPVPVAELIEDVLNLTQGRWKREAERQGMTYRIHRVLAPVPPVLGDAAELREALTNLVLNALDAMPAGGELTVEAHAVPGRQLLLLPHAPGGTSTPEVEAVEISIRDTGSGMTEDVQRRAFDPFFTTKGARGTGLGLSVVYGIVTRHGGEVLLDSAPGRGTTVSLRLPAAPEVPRREAAPAAPAAVASPGTRVLVIDDEVDIREVIADVLGRAGYTVDVAADGHQGLEKFGSGQFDLVLTDLGMPTLSGWDVADAVKVRSPGTPVVLITGWGATVSEEQLVAHRIDRLLAKPFRLQDLAASVNEVITRARNVADR